MYNSRLITLFGFILIGIASRLIPHPPNFTSLNALALFSVLYFNNRWVGLALVTSTLFLSDLMIGFHSTMPFIYLSFGLTVWFSDLFKKYQTFSSLIIKSVCASLLFFAVSNFGVWWSDVLYAKSLAGLISCYLAAIPFLANQITGDLVYVTIFLGFAYSMSSYHLKAKI